MADLPDGTTVRRLRIGSPPGPVATVLDLGASLQELEVTCGDGVRRNVVLGHADTAARLASTAYLGSVVGRYANRIAGGRFGLDGHEVHVGTNDRGNTLHGGPDGFDRRVWEVVAHDERRAELELVSPDGDQGFPGTLTVRATYAVEGDTLSLELRATTDAPTVVSLTSHAYLNLDGEGAGTVDDHLLAVAADRYLPTGPTGIPTGIEAVDGTPFDLRAPRRLGEVAREGHEQVMTARGLDHCLLVPGEGLRRMARLESPRTRTSVELWSDLPGVQVYTGNFLDGTDRATGGGTYRQGDGIALEAQHLPDAPNHPEWPPSTTLRPGETFRAHIEWRFA